MSTAETTPNAAREAGRFTSGPWHHGAESDEVFATGAKPICDIALSRDFITDAEADSNARLIAAAPDLLGILLAVLPTCEAYADFVADGHIIGDLAARRADVAALRAALARATGGAQ